MLIDFFDPLRLTLQPPGRHYNPAMLPVWSHALANLYYLKRWCRIPDHNCRRRAWRKIAVEKKRLLGEGVEYIELHLVCRVLTNPRNQNARDRLRTYYAQGRLFG